MLEKNNNRHLVFIMKIDYLKMAIQSVLRQTLKNEKCRNLMHMDRFSYINDPSLFSSNFFQFYFKKV